jgi:hypothetical protein
VEAELQQPEVWEHVKALVALLKAKPILLGADLENFFSARGMQMAPSPPARQ